MSIDIEDVMLPILELACGGQEHQQGEEVNVDLSILRERIWRIVSVHSSWLDLATYSASIMDIACLSQGWPYWPSSDSNLVHDVYRYIGELEGYKPSPAFVILPLPCVYTGISPHLFHPQYHDWLRKQRLRLRNFPKLLSRQAQATANLEITYRFSQLSSTLDPLGISWDGTWWPLLRTITLSSENRFGPEKITLNSRALACLSAAHAPNVTSLHISHLHISNCLNHTGTVELQTVEELFLTGVMHFSGLHMPRVTALTICIQLDVGEESGFEDSIAAFPLFMDNLVGAHYQWPGSH